MSVFIFQENLMLIQKFINKLEREHIASDLQRILIKGYATDLRINLTNQMISELLTTNTL